MSTGDLPVIKCPAVQEMSRLGTYTHLRVRTPINEYRGHFIFWKSLIESRDDEIAHE
ncbi:MAG: hypothetical protein DSM106950_12980 [Stigonema ocellatum SAG 48.90 = DSM 106950]|nr:hypothetical protein [Stigonema ocellatum SAG 48.90 = DSM 106950]